MVGGEREETAVCGLPMLYIYSWYFQCGDLTAPPLSLISKVQSHQRGGTGNGGPG